MMTFLSTWFVRSRIGEIVLGILAALAFLVVLTRPKAPTYDPKKEEKGREAVYKERKATSGLPADDIVKRLHERDSRW